jgi:predicted Zn-dependent protease
MNFIIFKQLNMKKITLLIVSTVFYMSCSKNLVTGRKQLKLVSETELQAMADTEYNTFLKSNAVVSSGDNRTEMVKRVGSRIANAIKKYYDGKGQPSVLAGYNWEFNLVESKEVNAWCMPGGKVVVYTGILPITQTEAGLAVVLGHEITHAVAQHGSERMSQGLVQQLGGTALQIALSGKPTQTQNLFLTAYGVGSNVVGILPYSRNAENEADKYGLFFMAMAAYNPEVAIPFWERMAVAGGGSQPEFLSTHPSDASRISKLKSNMPQANKYYKAAIN